MALLPMKTPSLAILDFETTGLEYWHPDFKVTSAAVSWASDSELLGSSFADSEEAIQQLLTYITENKLTVIVYNANFELGVLQTQYPRFPRELVTGDVMRLVQLYGDAGKYGGYGLKAATARILGHAFAGYEQEIYAWIRENVPEVKKGKEGAHLSKAPRELLEAYNIADVENTYRLYQKLTAHFRNERYNWKPDHELYFGMVKRVTQAKIDGQKVDVEALKQAIIDLDGEIQAIDTGFLTTFEKEIKQARLRMQERITRPLDTEILELMKREPSKMRDKMIASRQVKRETAELPAFNPASKQHLKMLFCDVLGLKPRLWTPHKTNPQPSFKRAHLFQWGSGGEMLSNRGKLFIAATQAKTLLEKASFDGRWHIDLRLVATTTGRAAGGGSLNCQGLSRRNKKLMNTLVSDECKSLISIDLVAGEPTVIAHFTKDPLYRYCTFEGVGKEPYYQGNILMIDDIYLMVWAASSFGEQSVKRVFNSSFVKQWLEDKEVITKGVLKKDREIAKTLALAIGYGARPKKLYQTLLEKNIIPEEHNPKEWLKRCKEFFDTYWGLFPEIAAFGKRKEEQFECQGYLVNPFGFRFVPIEPKNCFNNFIQSTVNGIMCLFADELEAAAPYAKFKALIHDEVIYEVPDDKLEDFRQAQTQAADKVNKELNWSTEIRFGFAPGKTWYEAK